MKTHSLFQRLTLGLVMLGVVVSFFILLPVLVLAESEPVFEDVSRVDQSYVAIYTLADREIVKGVSEGVFGGNQSLNRAQAVMLVLRYAGHQVSEAEIETSAFSDVDKTQWYAAAVQQATDLKITQGNPDGTFAPARQVTSAELLTMMARADAIDLSIFTEESGAWYQPVMSYAQQAGIFAGEPGQALTREGAAQIIYLSLLLQQAEDNDFLSSQSQSHLSQIESTVAANELGVALYHADLAVKLMAQVTTDLPNDDELAAEEYIALAYRAWVQSIVAALQSDADLALDYINITIDSATEAYFKNQDIQPLAAHLKDIGCEVYFQLPEEVGEMPEDCVERLIK